MAVAVGTAVAVNVAVAVLVGVGIGVEVCGIAVGIVVGFMVADDKTVAVSIGVDTAVGILVIEAADWTCAVDGTAASVGEATGITVNASVLKRAGVEVATIGGVAAGVAVRVGVWDGVDIGEGVGVTARVGRGTGVDVCVTAVDAGEVVADKAAGAAVGVGGCKSRTSIGAGGVAVFGVMRTTVAAVA